VEKVIKKKGQILTMTAEEAREWGLSEGTAESVEQLRAVLGVAKWHNASDAPGEILDGVRRKAEARVAEESKGRERASARAKNTRASRPELDQINRRMTELAAKMIDVLSELDRIRFAVKSEGEAIKTETKQAVAAAQRSTSPSAGIAAAQQEGKRKAEELRQKYVPQVEALNRTTADVEREIKELRGRRQEILASLDGQ
jgi:hypothetical protein